MYAKQDSDGVQGVGQYSPKSRTIKRGQGAPDKYLRRTSKRRLGAQLSASKEESVGKPGITNRNASNLEKKIYREG